MERVSAKAHGEIEAECGIGAVFTTALEPMTWLLSEVVRQRREFETGVHLLSFQYHWTLRDIPEDAPTAAAALRARCCWNRWIEPRRVRHLRAPCRARPDERRARRLADWPAGLWRRRVRRGLCA